MLFILFVLTFEIWLWLECYNKKPFIKAPFVNLVEACAVNLTVNLELGAARVVTCVQFDDEICLVIAFELAISITLQFYTHFGLLIQT